PLPAPAAGGAVRPGSAHIGAAGRGPAAGAVPRLYAYSTSRRWKANAPSAAMPRPSSARTAAWNQSGLVAGASAMWVKSEESRIQSWPLTRVPTRLIRNEYATMAYDTADATRGYTPNIRPPAPSTNQPGAG